MSGAGIAAAVAPRRRRRRSAEDRERHGLGLAPQIPGRGCGNQTVITWRQSVSIQPSGEVEPVAPDPARARKTALHPQVAGAAVPLAVLARRRLALPPHLAATHRTLHGEAHPRGNVELEAHGGPYRLGPAGARTTLGRPELAWGELQAVQLG